MTETSALPTDIVENLMKQGFDGILILITNPCDVLAYRAFERSGLPLSRVFSTGTALDSARLIKQLSLATGIDHKSISAIVMGEHGASQAIPWSAVTIYGQTLGALSAKDPAFAVDRAEIRSRVMNGAWTAVDGKGVAEYGVASALTRLVGAVFHDEKAVLPVSAGLTGEYGVTDVYAGVPAVIGRSGIERIIELPLPDEELAEFRNSCDILKKARTGI